MEGAGLWPRRGLSRMFRLTVHLCHHSGRGYSTLRCLPHRELAVPPVLPLVCAVRPLLVAASAIEQLP